MARPVPRVALAPITGLECDLLVSCVTNLFAQIIAVAQLTVYAYREPCFRLAFALRFGLV